MKNVMLIVVGVLHFESWSNPQNGGFFLLERGDSEKYKLVTPLRIHDLKHQFQFAPIVDGDDLFPMHNVLPYY